MLKLLGNLYKQLRSLKPIRVEGIKDIIGRPILIKLILNLLALLNRLKKRKPS